MSDYPGKNSPKDVQQRVAVVEETSLPSARADILALENQFNEEVLDSPDFSLLFNAALT